MNDFMNARISRALVLSALLAAPGCGSTKRAKPFDAASAGRVTVVVTNEAWWDVEVYQLDGGMAWRLGRVTALGSARLTLKTSSGAVRLVLRPLASVEDVPLEEVWVTPGGRVELFIAPRLERSMLLAR